MQVKLKAVEETDQVAAWQHSHRRIWPINIKVVSLIQMIPLFDVAFRMCDRIILPFFKWYSHLLANIAKFVRSQCHNFSPAPSRPLRLAQLQTSWQWNMTRNLSRIAEEKAALSLFACFSACFQQTSKVRSAAMYFFLSLRPSCFLGPILPLLQSSSLVDHDCIAVRNGIHKDLWSLIPDMSIVASHFLGNYWWSF